MFEDSSVLVICADSDSTILKKAGKSGSDECSPQHCLPDQQSRVLMRPQSPLQTQNLTMAQYIIIAPFRCREHAARMRI